MDAGYIKYKIDDLEKDKEQLERSFAELASASSDRRNYDAIINISLKIIAIKNKIAAFQDVIS